MDNLPIQIETRQGAGVVPAAVVGFVVGLIIGVMALVVIFSLVIAPVFFNFLASIAEPAPTAILWLLRATYWVKDIGWLFMAVVSVALIVALVVSVKGLRASASRGQA